MPVRAGCFVVIGRLDVHRQMFGKADMTRKASAAPFFDA
jgi:hypothetical protein